VTQDSHDDGNRNLLIRPNLGALAADMWVRLPRLQAGLANLGALLHGPFSRSGKIELGAGRNGLRLDAKNRA
jgi:hypothetical protein